MLKNGGDGSISEMYTFSVDEKRQNSSSGSAERDSMENPKFQSNQVFCPSNNLNENDNKALLTKSNSRRFTSIKKMFDPLTKSNSRRSPLISNLENKDIISSHQIVHGDLRLEHKHGVPYFELSLPDFEQTLVAKTWKSEDTHNWVYTFHSFKGKKKSNGNKVSPIVAQMQVSSSFSNSMVTEFVLYDTMQKRKSSPIEELSLYPWGLADLDPSLEIGAIVFEAPLKKRGSLKYSSGDAFSHQVQLNAVGRRVDVVIPMGNHSLGDCENRGPLSLLDKWRFGGGCDCGGWDMACPLLVFSNCSTEIEEDNPFLQQDRPFQLCVQGSKQKTPALTIHMCGKGKYVVDFQAQLSTLQAFGICIAVLHSTDASTTAGREKKAQFNTLKDLFEDEMKTLIESVTEKKVNGNHPSSFMLNPPFSPISRV